MKYLGILILAVGVGLCAAFGAKLSDGMYERTRFVGQQNFLGAEASEAKKAYCEARATAKLPEGECAAPKAEEEPAEPEEAAEAAAAEKAPAEAPAEKAEPQLPTYEEALAAETAKVDALAGGSSETLPAEVRTARDAWIAAARKTIEPSARLASTPLPGPGERLSNWFTLAGMPFIGGLVLIIIGAIIGRRAVQAELQGTGSGASDSQIDFDAAIKDIAVRVRNLADETGEEPQTDAARRDAVRQLIEAIQQQGIDPVVEARHRLQNQLGLAGFADVFSPFSAGERRLNRAWSALADHHWPEARDSIGVAAAQMDAAVAALEQARQKA